MKRFQFTILVVVACVALSLSVATNAATAPGTITLSNFQFTPKVITVKAGATVTWSNKEGTHTVSADDGSWESPTLNAGQTFTHKFDKPGTYAYHCSFHGSAGHDMAGSVKVVK